MIVKCQCCHHLPHRIVSIRFQTPELLRYHLSRHFVINRVIWKRNGFNSGRSQFGIEFHLWEVNLIVDWVVMPKKRQT